VLAGADFFGSTGTTGGSLLVVASFFGSSFKEVSGLFAGVSGFVYSSIFIGFHSFSPVSSHICCESCRVAGSKFSLRPLKVTSLIPSAALIKFSIVILPSMRRTISANSIALT